MHKIHHKQYDLELHFECQNTSGKIIVILVLFRKTDNPKISNDFLKNIGLGTGNIALMEDMQSKEVIFYKIMTVNWTRSSLNINTLLKT